jgi:GNAT superfamily N-acetyltransferase
MIVRLAETRDIATIIAMSRRVQSALEAAGSRQQFGPIPGEIVTARVAAGAAQVLQEPTGLLGSVFVGPATPDLMPTLKAWGFDDTAPLWWLEKLMIEPREQGRGLGRVLMAGVQAYVASQRPGATIVLDCWAGNDKLRAFYSETGFSLQGIFGEHDYEISVFAWTAPM